MCIHSDEDRRRYDEILKNRASTMRTVALKAKDGRLIAAWPTYFADTQKVANTLRDIKAWHSYTPDMWVDLSAVNAARLNMNLEALDNDGLPIAIGEPLPQDMDVDLVLRGRDGFTEFERGLQRYIKAQEQQLAAAHV